MIGIERRFSDDTRLIDLTVGDLKELITSLISKIKQIEEKRYVYGLQGLGLSLKPWGIALKFLFLHHENILFPND